MNVHPDSWCGQSAPESPLLQPDRFPEAALGLVERLLMLDQRVDVYGFGAIVFRALGGRPPFESDNLFELMTQVMKAPRPSLCALAPALPAAMDDWVLQSLAVDPKDRFLAIRGQYAALGHALGLG